MFRDSENYRFFMEKFQEYLIDILDIYSYSLMPSHFHYIVKIRSLLQMHDFLQATKIQTINVNEIVTNQFRSFFTSYTMSFNKYHKRQGSLFNHKFRRVEIHNDESLKDCIFYVHSNPVHHSITKSFMDYRWSSYPVLLSDEPTVIKREEVFNLFGGKEEFINYHREHQPVIAKPR